MAATSRAGCTLASLPQTTCCAGALFARCGPPPPPPAQRPPPAPFPASPEQQARCATTPVLPNKPLLARVPFSQVYGVLSCQLGLTAIIAAVIMFNRPVQLFFLTSVWLQVGFTLCLSKGLPSLSMCAWRRKGGPGPGCQPLFLHERLFLGLALSGHVLAWNLSPWGWRAGEGCLRTPHRPVRGCLDPLAAMVAGGYSSATCRSTK